MKQGLESFMLKIYLRVSQHRKQPRKSELKLHYEQLKLTLNTCDPGSL